VRQATQVVERLSQRVLEGKKVPSDERILSLVELHTEAVPRSPWWRAGHARAHVEGRIVTQDEIMEHPTEHGQAATAVGHHVALFDHLPGLLTANRGVPAADTEARLRHRAIPASGKRSNTPAPFAGSIASARASSTGLRACGGNTDGMGGSGSRVWT
jgi:hypothetical protein